MSTFKSFPPILFFIILSSVVISCNNESDSRPSPLEKDSVMIGEIKVSIAYSSPGVKERTIWGELVPYDQVWRTGANKATTITTTGDILINGKLIPEGKYSVFTIPTDSVWTVILNTEWDQWGSYNYNDGKDLVRIEITPKSADFTERMSFQLEPNALKFSWENLSYSLSIRPAN